MRKMLTGLFSLLLVAITCIAMSTSAQAKEKVILDSDMVEVFDDGVAMLLLAHSPKVDLLGITTVTGNSWVEQGTAYGLHQLELDQLSNIKLYPGISVPLRPNRHMNFEAEKAMFGTGYDMWFGSFGQQRPKSWQDFYKSYYKKAPVYTPGEKSGVNFIIDTIRANPGEVTIAAIGPCTNIAAAVRIAPDIVEKAKRIVYMGGSFFMHGNTTPNAEFNWFIDPEAAKIAVNAPWKEQVIFGLDVCEKVVFKKEHYDRLLTSMEGSPHKAVLRNNFVGQGFENDPNFSHFVWDVLVSAYIIDPSIVTGEVVNYVDVNDTYGPGYGQALAYPHQGPAGSQKAHIITEVNADRFWDILNEKQYWPATN